MAKVSSGGQYALGTIPKSSKEEILPKKNSQTIYFRDDTNYGPANKYQKEPHEKTKRALQPTLRVSTRKRYNHFCSSMENTSQILIKKKTFYHAAENQVKQFSYVMFVRNQW